MKRKAAILLTVATAVSLTACGGNASQENSGNQSAAGSTAQTTETGSSSAETEGGEINLYGYEEPVTIKVGLNYQAPDLQWYGGETSTNNTWMELYKKNNIIPDILYDVDSSQGDTKLSTAILSGDYPDVFYSKVSDYKTYVESGVVADITDVYEKYASDELKEYMASDSGMGLESLYVDGKLYGLPKLGSTYGSCRIMFIRQDWLDKLGLAIPTTMEELKQVAHAFTYDDPDGNGKNDTYGLALDGINIINNSVGDTEPIFNAFGCYLGKDGMTYVKDESGEVTWGASNTEGMKAALQFLQDLYKDGSLAKNFITMDSSSIFEETGSGRCGIWFGPSWGGMNPGKDAARNDINARVVAAAVPDGIDQGGTKAYVSSAIEGIYCVSSKCANPEILIKLWNLSVKYQNPQYVSPEEYNMYYGDSSNYTGWKISLIYGGMPDTGKTTFFNLKDALESGDPGKLNTKELENYTSIKTYMDAVEAGTFDPEDPAHQRGLSLYTVYGDPLCAWETICKMQDDNQYVLSAYNAIPSETVTNSSATLKKLLVETIVKVITGDSADSYDSFLQTWYAMGGQDALDEANGK